MQRTRFLAHLAPALYHAAGATYRCRGSRRRGTASDVSGLAALGAVVLILVRSLSYGQSMQTALQGLHEGAPYIEMLRSEDEKYRAAAISWDGEPLDVLGEVAFEGVSFEYVPEVPVLHDVSFRVPKGDVIGIIGPSGAGKSTLVQLLLRLRDPTHGRILADGRDVQGLALDDWYHRVTYVPQEPRFFAGTVADNIRFLRDGCRGRRRGGCGRRAHLHDDVMSCARGLRHPGGRTGRRSIRWPAPAGMHRSTALVGEPDLVVLDEPTSALDAKSEALMRDTMRGIGATLDRFRDCPSTLDAHDLRSHHGHP